MREHILHEDMSKSFDFASVRYVGPVKKKKKKMCLSTTALPFCIVLWVIYGIFVGKRAEERGKSGFTSGTHGRNLYYAHGWFISVSSFNILTPRLTWILLTLRLLNCFHVSHLPLMWCKRINTCASYSHTQRDHLWIKGWGNISAQIYYYTVDKNLLKIFVWCYQ